VCPNAATAARLGHNAISVSSENDSVLAAQHANPRQRWQQVSDAAAAFRHRRANYHEQVAARAKRRETQIWHRSRADGLRKPLVDKIAECGCLVATLMHRETGELIEKPVGCSSRLCATCAKRKAKRVYARLVQRLMPIEKSQAKRNRIATLLTLTVTLDEKTDIAQRSRIIRKAWKNFRASWHAAYGFAFKFLRFEEITAGKSRQGHLHWHVLAFLPKITVFHKKAQLQRFWRKACMRARQDLGITNVDQSQNCDVSPPRNTSGGAGIASYAGKIYRYISKENEHLGDLSPEVCAEYLDATYGLRIFAAAAEMLEPMATGQWEIIGISRVNAEPAAPQPDDNLATGPPAA
jgi:hypothetical protein